MRSMPQWRVPHFEKMLYNQALISQALVQAYRITGRLRYATALRETLDHVIRDMQLPGGAFATAFDADSKTTTGEKKEGTFFVWTPGEIGKALADTDAELAGKVFGITKDGNFHGGSIPYLTAPIGKLADTLKLNAGDLAARLATIKSRLNDYRSKRPWPLRDDKILTSWNALMIRALADASGVLSEPAYRDSAAKAAEFLWRAHFKQPGELRRFSFEGKTSLLATQPDHAFLAVAFVALYDATRDAKWLRRASELADVMHKLFLDGEARDYYMAKTDDPIPQPKVRSDQPLPSGNAVALELFAKLSRRTLSLEPRQRASDVLAASSGIAAQSPITSGYLLKSADEFLRGELGRVQFLGKGRVRVELKRTTPTKGTLHVTIAKGWHINAHKPLQDHYIPTQVNLQGPGDPMPTAVKYPKAIVQKLGFADDDMALYEGEFSIAFELPSGEKTARAILFLAQACSDKICLDPETLSMTLMPMPEKG